jgi:hypothetical protein
MRSRTSSTTSRHRRPAASRGAATLLLAGALLLAVLAPPAAQAGCITRLPVRVSLPDGPYAIAYAKQIRVRVTSRGPRIRKLRAELYTFGGQRVGASVSSRTVRTAATLKLALGRIYRPLQLGSFTLVLTGEPNASRSCGPKQATHVLAFRACKDTLPVSFPDMPGGRASDYGGFLSVPIRSDGAVIRDLRSAVYAFDGSLLGRAPNLLALFGQQTLDHRLDSPLLPGSYTVIVEGLIADQPRACGRKASQATMTFQ